VRKISSGSVPMFIVGVAMVVLAGCGSSADRPGTDSDGELGSLGTTNNEAGLREAARAYLDAWSSGNSAIVCGLLTAGKARGIGMQFGDGSCPSAVTALYGRMSEDVRNTYADAEITKVSTFTNQGEPGGLVKLSADLEGPLNGVSQFMWSFEAGRWQTTEEPEG
jgi:hypothetical protein